MSSAPERVNEIARQTIIRIAQEQGAALAESMGGCTLAHFAASLGAWTKGGALEMDVLEQSEGRFAFNVTRCRYAEMYRALGIPELGALLSCNRDFALIQGFNPSIELTRTQTIMGGAAFCDFRYELKPEGAGMKTLLIQRHAKSRLERRRPGRPRAPAQQARQAPGARRWARCCAGRTCCPT